MSLRYLAAIFFLSTATACTAQPHAPSTAPVKAASGLAVVPLTIGSGSRSHAFMVEVARTTDGGQRGLNVDMVKAGDWLEYTVDVPTGGMYDVNFRVSNLRNGGSFHLTDMNTGQKLTGSVAIPGTGDWNKYVTLTRQVTLSQGRHVLRLAMDTNSSVGWVGNFNWMGVS